MSLIICIFHFLLLLISASEVYHQQQLRKIRNFPRLPFGESLPLSNLRSMHQAPDIFKAITEPEYARTLPNQVQNFVRIFYEGFSAYWTGFALKGYEEFELLNWSKSPIVESMSFEFHLYVIQQTIDQGEILSKEFGHEFIDEYLEYAFSRSNSSASIHQYTNLLKSAIKILDAKLLASILKYAPSVYSQNFIDALWRDLIKISVDKTLYLASKSSSNQTSNWFKMYYLLSRHFGTCESLLNFVVEPKESEDYSIIFEMDDEIEERKDLDDLNKLVNSQPLFASLINHDAESFSYHYALKSETFKPTFLAYYLNLFIHLDEDIKYFNPEKEEELAELADTLFTSLNWRLDAITEFCFQYSYNDFIQFILLHSKKARASIPSKHEQCRILSKFIQKSKFDGQSIKLAWIAAFQLTRFDLESCFLPYGGTEMIRVLLYVMKIVC